MNLRLAAPLVIHLAAVGCGGDDDGPTTPTPRTFTYDATAESTIAAHALRCGDFRQEAPGPASASVDLELPIEIGTGTCAGARSVVARSDKGSVTATLPAGDSYVRFENTSDSDARYRLTLRYLMLY
jgi:hypothetical protein